MKGADHDTHVAQTLTARYRKGTDSDATDTLLAQTLTSGSHQPGVNAPGRRKEDDVNLVAHTLRSEGFDASEEDGTGRGTPLVPMAYMPHRTLQADGSVEQGYAERPIMDAVHQSTGTGSNKSPLIADSTVRRLTPVECERLQGFPDNWTAIDGEPVYEKRGRSWRCVEGTPDGPRYAAMGDAVTVPVAEWIGRRLETASRTTNA